MDTLETKMPAKCCSSEELVAFLYGEMNAQSRVSIEDHLAGCDACAGEFADLSFARLDVYEWHRDEFVEMATPPIVIPYAEAVSRSSWLDAFRGLFVLSGNWATAGTAFAAVAVVFVGLWLYGSKPGEVEVAGTDNQPTVVPVDERPVTLPTPAPGENRQQNTKGETQPQKVATVPVKKQSAEPAKATTSPAPRVSPPNRPVNARRPAPPRLNDFEDEDDTTLRLGDLLAEVDTRD